MSWEIKPAEAAFYDRSHLSVFKTMKNLSTTFFLAFTLCAGGLFFASAAEAFFPTTHPIKFDATHKYSPSHLTVEVGDTILWQGDFSQFSMRVTVGTTLPAGADPLPDQTTGMSFSYVIHAPGVYSTENPIWA